jgi:multisubunit Na+/H+ antiporter MnhB subunit
MIAVFFVLSDAPDLALTQLVIETLVLVIFLLVLDGLPSWYGEPSESRAAADALLAGAVGVTVFFTVLLTTGASPPEPIAAFFVETAPVPEEHGLWILAQGGGNNIVNVILVDFRAFDTLGEISVVAMAALSVLTLIGMRGGREESTPEAAGSDVEPEAVEAERLQPIARVAQQEALHLRPRVVEAQRVPARMEPLRPAAEILLPRAVEVVESVVHVLHGVAVDEVHDHPQAHPVGRVDERFELFGCAEAAGDGEEIAHVVAGAAVVGMLGDRHQLHGVVAEVAHAGQDALRKLGEPPHAPFFLRQAHVRLIDA